MSGLLWLLMLCSAVCGQDFRHGTVDVTWNKTVDHRHKIQSIFDLIQHRRVHCNADSGEVGSCMSKKECNTLFGSASGNCARNWGVCCVIRKKCGSTTKISGTYFTNPGYPGTLRDRSVECSITVFKMNINICQLRIDFRDVQLAQPNFNGTCSDWLQITDGSPVPVVCGDLSGQHVYVDFHAGDIPIRITTKVGHSSQYSLNRKWNIQITQIDCGSHERAPPYILQYFKELEGNVQSFNYNDQLSNSPKATRQIAKTNYVVGVGVAPHMCGIKWWQDPKDRYSFTVSGDTDGIVYELLGDPRVALTGDSCEGDCVIIPNTDVKRDRFCGSAIATVTTYTKPFTLTVVTGKAQYPVDFGNRGFSLFYRQIPCP